MSEWIKWEGGECTVSGYVHIKFRDGGVVMNCDPDKYRWEHVYSSGDIVAYMLVDEPPTEQTKPTALATQIGGDHYKKMKIQPTDFIMQNGLDFCQGNAIKYICRFRDKNGVQDLEKAKHYIDMLIEMEKAK